MGAHRTDAWEEWFAEEEPETDVPDKEPEIELIWTEVGPGRWVLRSPTFKRLADVEVPDIVTLKQRDIRHLELREGRTFSDRQELERYMELKDWRPMEKGDEQWRRRRENREWLASGRTDEERGPHPNKQQWRTVDR